jgi:DNA repair exonuclease SbcCD ATPase subunit
MRYAQLATILGLSAALTAAACNRAQQPAEEAAATVRDEAAEARQKMQEEAAELETKVGDLDREWNEMQAKVADDKNKATTALRAEVREDLTNAREAVADLKTTTEANWWERHEQRMERTAADVEQDVKRFARKWDAPKIEAEAAATADTWEARRDRFAARMEARIDAMENALKDVDLKGAAETEVEDTRARVKKMREDTDRLKNATEREWWDITRARVNDYIERVDRSIRRLDDDKG